MGSFQLNLRLKNCFTTFDMSDYDCPQCRSKNTQSYESVYAQNARTSYSATGGRYNSWNQLAAQTAPPEQPNAGCGAVLVAGLISVLIAGLTAAGLSALFKFFARLIDPGSAGGVVFLAFFAVGAATFIGGLIIVSRKVQKQMPAYRERLSEWSRSMLCRRCGFAWLRDE